MCYNSTLHSSTEFSLYFLFFGKCVILPIDGTICSARDTVSDKIDEYVKDQKDKIFACFDIAL